MAHQFRVFYSAVEGAPVIVIVAGPPALDMNEEVEIIDFETDESVDRLYVIDRQHDAGRDLTRYECGPVPTLDFTHPGH